MIQLRSMMAIVGQLRREARAVHQGARRHHKRYGRLGDIVVVSIKDAIPGAAVKKGDVAKAVRRARRQGGPAQGRLATSASTRTRWC